MFVRNLLTSCKISKMTRTEGVFAINKPASITSAQVIRDLQSVFNPSDTFASWIATEEQSRARENHYQRKRRKQKRVQVKIGHGGTLDPLATGVLIIGIGKGTKDLQKFLACTKTYETTVLFGAATDTYDITGKASSKAAYGHITREKVEAALGNFRGSIMQRPPIYSALRLQGKRLYEYAREGLDVPLEIEERPVRVEDLRIIEWLPPGAHQYALPEIEETLQQSTAKTPLESQAPSQGSGVTESSERRQSALKRARSHSPEVSDQDVIEKRLKQATDHIPSPIYDTTSSRMNATNDIPSSHPQPPAVKLQMTVTSGFYVRSLCHDLGKALGSLGIMASLIRTRQADFELGKNVLNYEDIQKDEDVWGPKVAEMLDAWHNRAVQDTKM